MVRRCPSRVKSVPYLFEVWPDSENFVDEILDAKNVVFSKCLLDHLIVGEWHPLFFDLSITTLVDQLANGLEVGLARERSTPGCTRGFKRRRTRR